MTELIKPLRTRHRVSFFGRKLILQYAHRRPIGDCGSWEIIWKDATYLESMGG